MPPAFHHPYAPAPSNETAGYLKTCGSANSTIGYNGLDALLYFGYVQCFNDLLP